MNKILLWLRRSSLARDRKGVAALEFSISALFIITLMLAAFDFGNAAQHQIELQAAVRAGGAYATRYPTDATGIAQTVTATLPAGWTLSASSVVCSCLNSSTGATSTTVCSAPTCTTDAKIITITATMPYTSISGMFAGVIPSNSATHVVRYQ